MKTFSIQTYCLASVFKSTFILLVGSGIFFGCNSNKKEETENTTNTATPVVEPASLAYEVIKTYPHDTSAFTEGFLFYNNLLFESTGSPSDMPQTRSIVGPVDLKTGKINTKIELEKEKYFGEGIVFLNNKLFQLTYQTKVGFVYDAQTYRKLQEFTFPSKEGWGLTTDGTYLIMSDGTSQLTYLDPNTFKTIKTINVRFNYDPLVNLNELEFIDGYIYANIFTTNSMVKIDPATGQVTGIMDLTNLYQQAKTSYPGTLEMNGIAFRPNTKSFFITGKFWPHIFELKVKR